MGYTDECWLKFISMKIDTQINVSKSVKPENLEAFKDAVKHFIDTDYGRQYGFELEPSNEWKFIRKKKC